MADKEKQECRRCGKRVLDLIAHKRRMHPQGDLFFFSPGPHVPVRHSEGRGA